MPIARASLLFGGSSVLTPEEKAITNVTEYFAVVGVTRMSAITAFWCRVHA